MARMPGRPSRTVTSWEDDQPPAPPARRRLLGPVVVVAATALVIGTIGWLNRTRHDEVGPGPARTESAYVTAWYVGTTGAGPRLFSERHRVTLRGQDDAVQAAVAQALGAPLDPDYRQVFPRGITAIVTEDAAGLLVDLHGSGITDPPAHPADAQLAVDAIALTAARAAGRPVQVRLRVNAATPDRVLGLALDPALAGRIRIPDEAAVLSPVSVELDENDVVRRTAPVMGAAAAPDGRVRRRLVEVDGTAFRSGVARTRECCRLSPYSFTTGAPAGRYRLEVSVSGAQATTETKTITLE